MPSITAKIFIQAAVRVVARQGKYDFRTIIKVSCHNDLAIRLQQQAWLYNRPQLSGYLTWVVWLLFQQLTLLGFRNRINVFVNWVYNYFTYDRSVRIILQERDLGEGPREGGSRS